MRLLSLQKNSTIEYLISKEKEMKIIKWIIKDLKLASKEDWFYVALGIPVSVFAYIYWFI